MYKRTTLHADLAREVDDRIYTRADWPKPGVLFRDVSPVLTSHLFCPVVGAMSSQWPFADDHLIAGLDARGFIFGAAMALHCGAQFLPVRKAGKLPPPTDREAYALEYGESAFEVPQGLVPYSTRVIVVDDVLATGGSARAAARLLRRQCATIDGFAFMLEIDALGGADAIRAEFGANVTIHSLLTY